MTFDVFEVKGIVEFLIAQDLQEKSALDALVKVITQQYTLKSMKEDSKLGVCIVIIKEKDGGAERKYYAKCREYKSLTPTSW